MMVMTSRISTRVEGAVARLAVGCIADGIGGRDWARERCGFPTRDRQIWPICATPSVTDGSFD